MSRVLTFDTIDRTGCSSAWLERLPWEQEVVGSNPATPIRFANREETRDRSEWNELLSRVSSVSFLLSVLLFMAFTFEKLIVYQKAIDFADQVCSQTEQFSRGYGFLVDQLNRAALSVAANIAEGNGRFTKPDRKNFFGIARGSVQECVPLLELAKRRHLISESTHSEMKERLEEIARMLSGLINGLENRSV